MKSKTQIRSSQAALAIFSSTIGTIYFPLAAIVVPIAGTSGWLTVIMAFLLATPWVLLSAWLARQAPSGNFGAAVTFWLGPIIGRLFLLWFATSWLLLASGLLAQTSFVFHAIALPATPVIVMLVALLSLVIYTDLHGFETCIRTMQVLLLVSLPLMLGFLLAAIASSKLPNLMPLLDVGFPDLAKATYLVSPYPMSGALFVLFTAIQVQDRNRIALYSVLANWAAGLLLALIVAVTVGVLGCCVTKAYVYPTVPLAQSINIGETLVGVELLVYPLWLLSGYSKVAVAFVIASTSIGAMLPALKQPWRTLGLGVLALLIAIMPQNLRATIELIGMNNSYLTLPFYLAIPAIALWVKIKKRM